MDINEVLAKYELKTGKHTSLDQGACVMELVSYIANEPWSDRPKCACPVLTNAAISFNDRVDDEHRQKLKEIIPLLLNSRNEEKRKARATFLCVQSVTSVFPIFTEALGLEEISKTLRAFTPAQMREAAQYIRDNRATIRTAAVAATYAAADADADAVAATYAAAAAAADADADAVAATYAVAVAAADADADKKKFCLGARKKIWAAWFESIKGACEL